MVPSKFPIDRLTTFAGGEGHNVTDKNPAVFITSHN